MIWIFVLLITVYILYTYLRSKEKNQLEDNLRDNEFRKSYIQNIIEQEFQSYLRSDLKIISEFRKKLADAERSNDNNEIKEAKFQVKFFSGEVSELTKIKKDLQGKDHAIWNHTDFSDKGITKLKEKISDSFSYAASAALLRIR